MNALLGIFLIILLIGSIVGLGAFLYYEFSNGSASPSPSPGSPGSPGPPGPPPPPPVENCDGYTNEKDCKKYDSGNCEWNSSSSKCVKRSKETLKCQQMFDYIHLTANRMEMRKDNYILPSGYTALGSNWKKSGNSYICPKGSCMISEGGWKRFNLDGTSTMHNIYCEPPSENDVVQKDKEPCPKSDYSGLESPCIGEHYKIPFDLQPSFNNKKLKCKSGSSLNKPECSDDAPGIRPKWGNPFCVLKSKRHWYCA